MYKLKTIYLQVCKNTTNLSYLSKFNFCSFNNNNFRHEKFTMINDINPNLEKIKSLLEDENLDIKKEFIIEIFNLNKNNIVKEQKKPFDNSQINDIIMNDRSDRKLKELLRQVLPDLNFSEKYKISETFIRNKKFPVFLFKEFLKEIELINQKEKLELSDLKNIYSILNLIGNSDETYLKDHLEEIRKLLIIFTKNFDKYKLFLNVDGKLFLKFFNKLFLLEKQSEKIQYLEYKYSDSLYEKLSKLITENFENVNLIELSNYLDICDKNFYKNDELYNKIINEIEVICNSMEIEQKYTFLKNIAFPLINSNSVIKNPNGVKFLNILLDYYSDQIEETTNIGQLIIHIKQLVNVHSIIFNDLPQDEKIKIKVNKILKTFIDFLHQILIEKERKFDANFIKKFYTSMYHPIVYVKSMRINKMKTEQILNLIIHDPYMKSILEKNIISQFHRNFLKYLIELDVKYTVEDKKDYLSKDIALDGYKICFELDGMKHYYRDKELKYSTKLRGNILRNFGWKVINVNYFEWQEMNDEGKREFVVKKINENI